MSKENRIWLIVFLLGATFLGVRMLVAGGLVGTVYVQEVEVNPDAENSDHRWSKYDPATARQYNIEMAKDPSQTEFRMSMSRTLGLWVAAFFTLAVMSFLFGDNPFYKVAESVFVGISAAYWMVSGFWDMIVPNLLGKLSPGLVRSWALPGLGENEPTEWVYIVPLLLGVMLLWRLSPKGGWISRWPMAFIIGVFCGFRLVSFIHADFLAQIRNSIVSLWVKVPQYAADGTAMLDPAGNPMMELDFWASFRNLILVIGILACIVYFFFSFEHKGVVGGTARLGIWFLMITFGAAFGYTVMGRIALLAIRIEFLFDDWLWLIDPTGKRLAADAVAMIWNGGIPLPMILM